MRTLVLAVIALSMTACTGPALLDESTTVSSEPPRQATTTSASVTPGPIRGALPDGTIFDIAFPTPQLKAPNEIRAELVLDHDGDEVSLPLAFSRGGPGSADLVFHAGHWSVAIEMPSGLEPETKEVIEAAIDVSTEVEMPVLGVQPPLRWARPPEIVYDGFVVRSGCPEDAAACNSTHAVSVIPGPGKTLDSPISVQSYALRPRSDANYLATGPLTARWSPDIVWTGREMVVWGGSPNGGQPTLIDGAAFDPARNQWRMLPAPPLPGTQATRAVWAGTEMVVIGDEATAAWNPVDDNWRTLTDGLAPPFDPGMTVAIGTEVFTWTSDGLYRLGPSETWELLPDPGVGEPDLFQGSVLRVVDSTLFAIGSDECERLIAHWDGKVWGKPIRISLGGSAPSCGHPNQTAAAGGKLIAWDDTSGTVVSYDPSSGGMGEAAPFPLPETDRASGPVVFNGSFLVSADLEAAVFDAVGGGWSTVELPGLGTDVDMVWTGEEVLAWSKCCYGPSDVDAWRWAPPSS